MKITSGISGNNGGPGELVRGKPGSISLLNAGEFTVETLIQAVQRPVASRSVEGHLDGYLDAIADAMVIFREAVDAALNGGSDAARWRQAERIAEHMRMLDDMQQMLETGVHEQSPLRDLVCEMIDPLTGVGRLLKDLKRQVAGFAVVPGLCAPGHVLPAHLVSDIQDLTEEVCVAVDALVDEYRPATRWWKRPPSAVDERRVSSHESRADLLSMQLLKKIFADDSLDLKSQLGLAQFVEEIDRVADYAEEVDVELRATRIAGQAPSSVRDTH